MNKEQFYNKFENDELMSEYAEFIMENSKLLIPNGNALTELMEKDYLLKEFEEFYITNF